MDGQTILDALQEDAATFIATMCYRDRSQIEGDVLNHDGHVMLISKSKMQGKHCLWRALYASTAYDDHETLIVSPNKPGARGSIMLLQDEMERAPFTMEAWGVKSTSETEIRFENGSRIVSHHTQSQSSADQLRGYHPDLLVVDNWEEEGKEIPETVMDQIILPIVHQGESSVWVNDTWFCDDKLMRAVLDKGAYTRIL